MSVSRSYHCESGLASHRSDSYLPHNYFFATTPSRQPIRPGGCTIYVPNASVVEVTFSGSIKNLFTVTSVVGFQLSLYNVLSGPVSESQVLYFPKATIANEQTAALSTTYRWALCSGTYVVTVYLVNDSGTSLDPMKEFRAWGELSIGINKK